MKPITLQGIEVRYHGPTAHRPARLSARWLEPEWRTRRTPGTITRSLRPCSTSDAILQYREVADCLMQQNAFSWDGHLLDIAIETHKGYIFPVAWGPIDATALNNPAVPETLPKLNSEG